jgi:hypothetical protein
VADVVAIGSILSVAGDGAVDEALVVVAERRIVDTEALGDAGAEAFE